jgi:hypothetical protein
VNRTLFFIVLLAAATPVMAQQPPQPPQPLSDRGPYIFPPSTTVVPPPPRPLAPSQSDQLLPRDRVRPIDNSRWVIKYTPRFSDLPDRVSDSEKHAVQLDNEAIQFGAYRYPFTASTRFWMDMNNAQAMRAHLAMGPVLWRDIHPEQEIGPGGYRYNTATYVPGMILPSADHYVPPPELPANATTPPLSVFQNVPHLTAHRVSQWPDYGDYAGGAGASVTAGEVARSGQ